MPEQQADPNQAWLLIRQGRKLRVGRSLGRSVYVQTGTDDPKKDLFIGVMDSPLIAAYVVDAVNRLQEADGGSE
jgi:hypothetical protein